MLTTDTTSAKERVCGHYEVTQTPWATDYVWVPGDEEVERRLLDEILRPWHAVYAEWANEAGPLRGATARGNGSALKEE